MSIQRIFSAAVVFLLAGAASAERSKKAEIVIAKKAETVIAKKVEIVIGISREGEVQTKQKAALVSDEEIRAHLRSKKGPIVESGNVPWIHLRAYRDTSFNAVHKVIQAAAKEEIFGVIFGTPVDGLEANDEQEDGAQPGGTEIRIPKAGPNENPPQIQPFFIRIDLKGAISVGIGAAVEEMDGAGKEPKLLKERLKIYAMAVRAGNSRPMVVLFVEDEGRYERVAEVLSALRAVEIDEVTFGDLEG